MELSKEENKAIEKINLIVDEAEHFFRERNEECEIYDGNNPIPINEYRILLNLISKLQKENEKQGKVIDEMADLISCECEDDWIVELWNIADGNIKELVKQYFYRFIERWNGDE